MTGKPPWALPDLARKWNCSLEQIELYAAYEGLQIIQVPVRGGREIDAVADEERLRFRPEAKPRDLRSDARQSYAEAVAILLAYAFGNDPATLDSYARESALAEYAAGVGLGLTRGPKTIALIFKEGAELLQQCGHIKPHERKRRGRVSRLLSQQDQGKEAAA